MNTDAQAANVRDVPRVFRLNALQLRENGGAAVDGLAWVWERAASIVDAALSSEDDAPLKLADAARESGKSADHLGRMVRQGKLPNAGEKGRPRIRRGDLRRVCSILPSEPTPSDFVDTRRIALEVVNS